MIDTQLQALFTLFENNIENIQHDIRDWCKLGDNSD